MTLRTAHRFTTLASPLGSDAATATAIATAIAAALCLLLAGCASALRDAEHLASTGQHEQALAVLDAAALVDPLDPSLRAARQRQRAMTITTLANQVDAARVTGPGAGQSAAARRLLAQLDAIDATHPRVKNLHDKLTRDERHQRLLASAAKLLDVERSTGSGTATPPAATPPAASMTRATALVREVLLESPGLPAARALQQRLLNLATLNLAALDPAAPNPALAPALAPESLDTLGRAFQKRLTLEFRDAALRTVFESISRSSGLNFVFDREVRADAKITIALRDVTLDEALRIILSTQQLDRKLLNDSSLLVYPDTTAKQEEHQELVTRSFYLSNADVKQAQLLIKTMAKTRDVYIDERLNLIIVRDTPEIVRLAERLIASIDLPEPEVMLEVEVMEIGTNRLNELGLQWPDTVQYGLPNFSGRLTSTDRGDLRASIANPALIATLRGSSGSTNLIANPKLRARNHEKAKVQIGERLPVFTSTAIANAGVATSVSYIDTGLKLEVEPSVQLDNDVVMKVSLEVSNLIGQVAGPQGSIAYRVGTRNASTSLRLRDGETQILAGLISDEDRKAVQGIPGASELPVLGRLFGIHGDTRNKTEVVLLITPRVVRNLGLPDAAILSGPAGNFANPGAVSTRLRPGAKAALALPARGAEAAHLATSGATSGVASESTSGVASETTSAAADAGALLVLETSGSVAVGNTVSVTLANRSPATLSDVLIFDTELLQFAGGPGGSGSAGEPLAFGLEPGGHTVFVLRALPGGAGRNTQISLDDLNGRSDAGAAVAVKLEGDARVSVLAR